MKDDPRERIETGKFLCRMEHSACWSIRRPDPYCGVPFADWSELVELAQKILAANDVAEGDPFLTVTNGYALDLESAKLAAVEAWRRWAREQAEAAGWEVQCGS